MTIALRTVRVGTRRSLLATTQAEQVAALLRDRLGVDTELVEVTTEGDRSQAAGTPLQDSSSTPASSSARCATRCWPARSTSPCTR